MTTGNWKPDLAFLVALVSCSPAGVADTHEVGAKEAQAGQNVEDRNIETVSRASGGDGPAEPGTCGTEEAIIFQCRSDGGRISVCGTKDQTGKTKVRFVMSGLSGSKALASDNTAPSANFSWAEVGYSGGGALQIRLLGSTHEWIAYSSIVRTEFGDSGQHDPQDDAGIVERLNGRVVLQHKCDDPWDATRYKADPAEYMPKGEFVALGLQ